MISNELLTELNTIIENIPYEYVTGSISMYFYLKYFNLLDKVPKERKITDIDLVIKPENAKEIIQICKKMGYTVCKEHKGISYVLIKNKKCGEKGIDYFDLWNIFDVISVIFAISTSLTDIFHSIYNYSDFVNPIQAL